MERKPKGAGSLTDQLRALLNDWDPIGCSPPPDEYDCLVIPLLKKLQAGCNSKFISRFLSRQIEDHFGMNPQSCGAKDFAKKVCEWYRQLVPGK